jgi:uroporphyrinogen decarboxylase
MIHNERLVRACRRQEVDRAPVWMMRQAGRYLSEYRGLRSRVPFLTLCKEPELAAQVSLQPYEILGVDAVILFSDILIPAEAMGMGLTLSEKGPQLSSPVRSREQVDRLAIPDPASDMPFVLETIRLLRRQLKDEVPVIGFAGAPFTLATYMIEGGTSRVFAEVKQLIYREPATAHALLDKIADVTVQYLNAQIEAGVHVVQLFDTWAGELGPSEYEEFALRYEQKVFESLHRGPEGLGVPAVLYINGCSAIIEQMALSGANVLSIDWRIGLAEARQRAGDKVAIQGNLDPGALLGTPETIAMQVDEMLHEGGPLGYIVNLGHGILPMTPVENARAFIEAAKKGIKEVA